MRIGFLSVQSLGDKGEGCPLSMVTAQHLGTMQRKYFCFKRTTFVCTCFYDIPGLPLSPVCRLGM